jgi:hypothetical protein
VLNDSNTQQFDRDVLEVNKQYLVHGSSRVPMMLLVMSILRLYSSGLKLPVPTAAHDTGYAGSALPALC